MKTLIKYTDDYLCNIINETEYYKYIDSNISDKFILDIIINNVFLSNKYESTLYHLLIHFNNKKLLKKHHYTQLIRQNYNVNQDIINTDEYTVIDLINDVKNIKTITIYLFNYLKTIIKLIKTEEDNHQFLLLLNQYSDLINKFQFIEIYVRNKDLHKSYKEWPIKYPLLWTKILNFYNLKQDDYYLFALFGIKEKICYMEHFDIEIKNLMYQIIENIEVYEQNNSIYNFMLTLNCLLDYTFANYTESNKQFYKIFNVILSNNIYETIFYKIIGQKYYYDKDIPKLIAYIKRNIDITYHPKYVIPSTCLKIFYDFIFTHMYDINTVIKKNLYNLIDVYYRLKLNDNNIKMNQWSGLLSYLLNYIFNNNIEIKLNYDNLILSDIINEYFENNQYNGDNSNVLNDLINEYISNFTLDFDCSVNMLKSNLKLVYNIVMNNIKILNADKMLEFIDKNNKEIFDNNDKEHQIKLYRFIDKYNNKIKGYKNLENKWKHYKLNISYISKVVNNLICDDLCKNIFDYL